MRNAWWCLLGVLAASAAAAQETQVSFAEPQPVGPQVNCFLTRYLP